MYVTDCTVYVPDDEAEEIYKEIVEFIQKKTNKYQNKVKKNED